MRKIFASRLKERQNQLNLTQAKMAELINVAPGTLSAYLKQDKVPTLEKAVEIATALNVTVGWLCGEDEQKNKSMFYDGHVSYSVIIRVILELNGISWEDTFEIRSEPVYSISLGKSITGVNIVIGDPVISKFFKDHQQVWELYTSNVVDREMYDAWVEKRLRELDNIPLNIDELPF